MKPLLTVFTFLLCTEFAFAQSDSGYLDLGRLRLKKEFTQVTHIKADDIARLPFLSLSEVIRSQANGGLTQKDQMVYVVDGITVTDADIYNIQDIEEITIVRNALVNQNGAGNLQLLALVRTKQWEEGSRPVTFSAKGAALYRKVVTNISASDRQTENVFSGNFQQYALTVRGGNQRINYGGSLGFAHDALPRRNRKDSLYDAEIPGIDRVKLNLWGRFVINKNNTLSAHFNYVPQTERSHMHQIQQYKNIDDVKKDREYLINPYINLETRVASFLNKFTFSYTNGRTLDSSNTRTEWDNERIRNDRRKDSMRAEIIQFNENLSFIKQAGNWQIEPSLNINFQKAFYKRAMATASAYEQDPIFGSYSFSKFVRYGKALTATPSLALSYNSLFILQGGLLLDGSKIIDSNYKNTRSYPFVNGTVNLARLLQSGTHFDWKIFGSYAERFSGFDGIFQLSDFNHNFVLPEVLGPEAFAIAFPSIPVPVNKFATQWQGGSSMAVLNERIRINYNYLFAEQRQTAIIQSALGNLMLYGKYSRKQQHLSIEADILRTDAFKWNVGLSINVLSDSSAYDGLTSYDGLLMYKQQPYTGGLVSRVQYKNFYAGVDMVYLLNYEERSMNGWNLVIEKYNAFQLANLFFAYRLNIRRFDGELFLSSRNLIDSAKYPISPDNKKYFGGGFKVSL